jgi:hypothetical protein
MRIGFGKPAGVCNYNVFFPNKKPDEKKGAD